MRPAARRVLAVSIGLLIAAMVGCMAVAGWLERRKFDRSGVPAGHDSVRENGRTFYVRRGGPPVDQRPHVAITAEQYQAWEEYDRLQNAWGDAGVLCLFAAAGVGVWLKLAGAPARCGRG